MMNTSAKRQRVDTVATHSTLPDANVNTHVNAHDNDVTRIACVWSACVLPCLSIHELARGYMRTHRAARQQVLAAYRFIPALDLDPKQWPPPPNQALSFRLTGLRVWHGRPWQPRAIPPESVQALLHASAGTLHELRLFDAPYKTLACLFRGPPMPQLRRLVLHNDEYGGSPMQWMEPFYLVDALPWHAWVAPVLPQLRELQCRWNQLEADRGTALLPEMRCLERLSILTNVSTTTCMRVIQRDASNTLVDLTIEEMPFVDDDPLDAAPVRAWFEARSITWRQLDIRSLHWIRDDDGEMYNAHLVHWLRWLPAVPTLAILGPAFDDATVATITAALHRTQPRNLHLDPWVLQRIPIGALQSVRQLRMSDDTSHDTRCDDLTWLTHLSNLQELVVDQDRVESIALAGFPTLSRLSVLTICHDDDNDELGTEWFEQLCKRHPNAVVSHRGVP